MPRPGSSPRALRTLRALVAAGLLPFAAPGTARAGEDAVPGGSDTERLQRLAGRPLNVRVLRTFPVLNVAGLGRWFACEEDHGYVIQAGGTRAILIPGQTRVEPGGSYRLRLLYAGQIPAPPRSGLPDPVGIYEEAAFRYHILLTLALQEEFEKKLDQYLSPGYLNRFLVSEDRLAEITPAMLARGLPDPIEENLSYFFVRAPSDRFQVAGVAANDGNFELRLLHPTTRQAAILYLPWNSGHPMRRAERGSGVEVGGFVRAVHVTPGGVSLGAYYRSEVEFVHCLHGRVRAQ